MRGILYVADKGEALPDADEQQPPPRQFVRMWKMSDLGGDAAHLNGRSLKRGSEMFQVAGCVQCHVIAGQGTNLGPDLTKVNEQFKGQGLLQQVLEPSSVINEQFQTYRIETNDGNVLAGLIVKQDADAVHLLLNPVRPKEVTVIRKSDIDLMEASKFSTMPEGLLMTLNKEEILDLLAFIESGGKVIPSSSQ